MHVLCCSEGGSGLRDRSLSHIWVSHLSPLDLRCIKAVTDTSIGCKHVVPFIEIINRVEVEWVEDKGKWWRHTYKSAKDNKQNSLCSWTHHSISLKKWQRGRTVLSAINTENWDKGQRQVLTNKMLGCFLTCRSTIRFIYFFYLFYLALHYTASPPCYLFIKL